VGRYNRYGLMIVTTVDGLKIKIVEDPLMVGEPYAFNVKGEDVWYVHDAWKPFPGFNTDETGCITRKSFIIVW
jgi:hypothetical protein